MARSVMWASHKKKKKTVMVKYLSGKHGELLPLKEVGLELWTGLCSNCAEISCVLEPHFRLLVVDSGDWCEILIGPSLHMAILMLNW